MRHALVLSFVVAGLLAGACYDSGGSGGSSSGSSSSTSCEGICTLMSELACGSQTFEECRDQCALGVQNLGPCISTFDAATDCAVRVGGTCTADGTLSINSGCSSLFLDHQACLQANFDAGG